jgi:hypothetical protein
MLEDQVWAETQKTVEEAVKAAVGPYITVVKRQECEIIWLKVGIIVIGVVAGGLGLWAALK